MPLGGVGNPRPRPSSASLLRLLGAALALAASALWAAAGLAREVPYFSLASDPDRQGFVRIANRSEVAGTVSIEAIDDAGTRFGPVTLSIGGGETVHFNSNDLEDGNADKGLPDGVGHGTGAWRLELGTDLDVEVLAYLRHRDGFLTAAHDVVPLEGGLHRVAFFNPASNWRQVSLLRLTNPGTETATVRIQGIDDAGAGGSAETTVAAGASRMLSAQDLEGMGLGDGTGKWQLLVDADRPLRVMSLLRSPTGHLTNLSTAPATAEVDGDGRIMHRVPLVPAAGGNVQGFVRVINHGDGSGEATVRAIDDSGIERGALTLALAGRQTVGFNSDDLARGNAAKGLTGSVAAGEGDWRLEIESGLPIEVLAYARTRDGFVTSLHDAAPAAGRDRHVVVLNPGSNWRQVGSLRLVNPGDEMAEVEISAVDDAGESPGLGASALLPAGSSATWTALDLEDGTGSGLSGAIGDGAGKWRLRVTSRQPVRAMSLMTSPTGHLTNLSTSTLPPEVRQVALAVDVEVPWGIANTTDVTVAALGRESAEAPVDGSSSVLVASDDGGTVLLALADEDGGYLDGGAGTVDVGIESTALALAAAASGHRLHGIDRSLAGAIRGHADFGRLVELLTGLMASDAHYLDRLYDYPDAVALVRAVASGAVEAHAESGTGSAAGPVPVRVKRALGARAAPKAQVDWVRRDDFYCHADNPVIRVVAGVVSWVQGAVGWLFGSDGEDREVAHRVACSPWDRLEPWMWYGSASGLESFEIESLWGALFDLAELYYDVAIDEALNGVPFLAVSVKAGEGEDEEPNGAHAIGNPNYVSFAMEAHTADGRGGWTYVPGNPTALRKLFNSGAAYLPASTGALAVLNDQVTMVRFTRHRFDFTSEDEARKLVSWANTIDLGLAAANLLTGGFSGARKALRDGDGWRACVEAISGDKGVKLDVAEGQRPRWTQGEKDDDGTKGDLWNFYTGVGKDLLTALAKAAVQSDCARIGLKAAGLGRAASAAAKLSSFGWAKLPFDIANETLPVAVGYLSPYADGVTYHLEWAPATQDRLAYISRVSTTRPPAARFTYRQLAGFELELDASETRAGDSGALTSFNWTVDGEDVGEGERLEHDFGAAGAYRVDLAVTDGNGVTGGTSSWVEVADGQAPTITSLRCAAAGEGRVRLSADFRDRDGEVARIEWCPKADCVTGEWTDSDEVGLVDEVVLGQAWGTHARVAAVDDGGNRTEETCPVEGASSSPPGRIDPPREAGATFREVLRSGGFGPEMVVIPAGTFRMGCLNDDGDCDEDEFPVHEVTFDEPFAVGKYEVTFDDYDRFTLATGGEIVTRPCSGSGPWRCNPGEAFDEGWGRGSRPVILVGPMDVGGSPGSAPWWTGYAAWLSEQTGATYRLLSEAEWEYAARAGTETKYSWGNDVGVNRANCDGCGSLWDGDRTAPVGSFPPNPYGLHDMHGNVAEFVQECSYAYDGSVSRQLGGHRCGDGFYSGDYRLTRGGSWYHGPASIRAASRDSELIYRGSYNGRSLTVGFRVARTLTP